jgi:signal transduction histidine kinase
MEMIVTFLICLAISVLLGIIFTFGLIMAAENKKTDFLYSLQGPDLVAKKVAQVLLKKKETGLREYEIQKIIDQAVEQRPFKILITDVNGKVLYKSANVEETKIDLLMVFKNTMYMSHDQQDPLEIKPIFSVYPAVIKNAGVYVIGYGKHTKSVAYYNSILIGGEILVFTVVFIGFIFIFLLLTKKKMKYIEELAVGVSTIATGNLDFRIEKKGMDELTLLADHINKMTEKLKYQIEEERKAERTKNELITNMSHDLRTPLTSIMGYLRLLHDKKYENEGQLEDFIDIAFVKSEKLKTLIEDLFDYTKLSNEGISLNISQININEMLEQLSEELTPVAEENELQFIKEFPQDKIIVQVDPDLMVRVFENLLINAVKYSYKPGEILIKLHFVSRKALICIENKGAHIPSNELPNLFNRLYRLDKSRSADSGGSGLGLAISKSIVLLHYGEIWAECEENTIRFFVELPV